MDRISNKISDNLIKNNLISFEEKEIYSYLIAQMLRAMLNIIISIIIGFWLGMIFESMVFTISLILIRSYSGGYHAKNPVSCFFISISALMFSLFSAKLGFWSIGMGILATIISLAVFISYSPVENENKPITREEKKKYKRILNIVLIILTILSVIFFVAGFSSLTYSIISAMLVNSLSVMIVADEV